MDVKTQRDVWGRILRSRVMLLGWLVGIFAGTIGLWFLLNSFGGGGTEPDRWESEEPYNYTVEHVVQFCVEQAALQMEIDFPFEGALEDVVWEEDEVGYFVWTMHFFVHGHYLEFDDDELRQIFSRCLLGMANRMDEAAGEIVMSPVSIMAGTPWDAFEGLVYNDKQRYELFPTQYLGDDRILLFFEYRP